MEGGICQDLSLFLHEGWTGLENKLGGRQRNAIALSANRSTCQWFGGLCFSWFGALNVGCTRYPTGCSLPTGNSFGRDPSLLET